jgi:hypothetical protein
MLSEGAIALGPDRLILLLLALLLDAYIGDPPLLYRAVPHPVALMRAIAAGLERLQCGRVAIDGRVIACRGTACSTTPGSTCARCTPSRRTVRCRAPPPDRRPCRPPSGVCRRRIACC